MTRASGEGATIAPRISVVVPAYNEELYLDTALASLHEAARVYREATGRAAEIIVVDNASTDGTAALARRRGARVVTEPHRQIAAARNRGAREARGEILVTCDADNAVAPRLLVRIDEVMSDGRHLGGGVEIRPEAGASGGVARTYRLFDRFSALAGVSFGVIYTRLDTFRRLGGFPSGVYVGEDALFVWALKREARRLGLGYATLRDVPVTTSTRKFREFGLWSQLVQHFKFFFMPWALRRRAACPTWYDVRDARR